ncbi:MAG: hypothetical protein SOY97_12820 [Candidatus Metalachnospira sp.]|nr:hypothetical protein [Candidatus Metalachnospira sp.]
MPNFETYKRIHSQLGATVGQVHKANSDLGMELTWDNDMQSRICYLYDFFHDDQPELNEAMTYNETTKTKIDAKFIVSKYTSMGKDWAEYYLQFKPTQKVRFDKNDELYYFETDYKNRYRTSFPVGLYVDVPDDRGTYHKWMIVDREKDNQFLKYSILPCEYYLSWIEQNGFNSIKRKMWSVLIMQNSFDTEKLIGYLTNNIENQCNIWLPLNSITEKMGYINYNGDRTNQRVIVSAPTDMPNAWKISKVESTRPFGIQKLTIHQDRFNPHTDYIEKDNDGNIKAMWADYYSSNVEPEDDNSIPTHSDIYCKITSSTQSIKAGGSYRLLTAKFYSNEIDITDNPPFLPLKWKCMIDSEDISELVSWLPQSDFNKIKIKFPNDRTYLNKILTVYCTSGEIVGEIKLEITV